MYGRCPQMQGSTNFLAQLLKRNYISPDRNKVGVPGVTHAGTTLSNFSVSVICLRNDEKTITFQSWH